jgi:CheY-like chemotaxis protein
MRGRSIARGWMSKVLVVDDDAQILKLLQVTFELEGYTVFVADCGERAVEVATEHDPDVVVCDLQMPRMSGLAVLERLRSTKKTSAIPFIMVTGSGHRIDAERALQLGANAYMTKPFDPFDLLASVQKVLRTS